MSFTPGIKNIAIILIIGIAAYWAWDWILENIFAIFGLGAAGAAAYKFKAEKKIAEADAHQDMANHAIDQAVINQKKADEKRQDAVKEAENIQDLPDKPAAGKVRKKFKIS